MLLYNNVAELRHLFGRAAMAGVGNSGASPFGGGRIRRGQRFIKVRQSF
jgi:hypothetical protein